MSISLDGLSNDELSALRAYVTANDDEKYLNLTPGIVQITLTHNYLKQKMVDLRVSLYMTVGDLKVKVYQRTGTPGGYQQLFLKDKFNNTVCELDDESKLLGYYGVQSGMIIYCVDHNPFSLAKDGGLEDVSKVKKYVMSDEEYSKRKNTYRAFKQQKIEEKKKEMLEENKYTQDSVQGIHINDRCEVFPGGRRGTVRWIGEYENPSILQLGYWVGVEFDEPVGKNDGSLNGKKYFECKSHYGGFVRGENVKVGDFPPDDFDSDFEDDDEI